LGLSLKHEIAATSWPWILAGIARLALLSAALALPRTATAQAQAQAERGIKAIVACDPVVAERILPVLRASLAPQGLDLAATIVPQLDPLQLVRAQRDPAAAGFVVQLWLDLVAQQPTMYLLDARSGLVYIRPLAVHADPDPVEIELIRFVVESSVEAMLKGSALGISRDEFERSLSPPEMPATTLPSPPTPTTRASTWAITAGYSGTLLASDFIAHGPELGAELRRHHFHLGIDLLQRFPLTVTRSGIDTRLTSSGVRIHAALPIALGSSTLATVGMGIGLDATYVSPAGNGAIPAFWATDPLVLALTTVERSLGDVLLSAHLGVEWDALASRYSATRSDGAVVLWTPLRFRPFVAIRLGGFF
jgi:hypothetical protein